MKNYNKKIHIIGGGTVAHSSCHLGLCAPAFGTTARKLEKFCKERFEAMDVKLHLTSMAGGDHDLQSPNDLRKLAENLVADNTTKIVIWCPAVCDFNLVVDSSELREGENPKYAGRLNSQNSYNAKLVPNKDKVVDVFRKERKDITLVAFKTTCGASKQEMYEKGLALCKKSSCNLVLVNDTKTRWNMIVTPEEAAYHETNDRDEVLRNLVDMLFYRSQLTFTRSTVVEGKPVPWSDERVPESLRLAVEHCIKHDAYKPFGDSTVGHFAVKISDSEFLTSIRKSNFNKLSEVGLVYVKSDSPDTVLAYGAKPSVGGQSQRIIFRDHVGFDCVLHFHSPLREDHVDDIPLKSQREVECGSHQCGQQTSDGLKQFENLKAVMLDNHGPNIIFPRNIDPQEVIDFVDRNFDLSKKTGGYNLNEKA